MNTIKLLFSLSLIISLFLSACNQVEKADVLIFTKTAGFVHKSIPTGIAALKKLGKENGFTTYATDDATVFTEESLKKFHAIVFLSTTGNILNEAQQNSMERFIQAGGGFVGIHAATDTEDEWPWYNKLVGAYFSSHPKIQEATLEIIDREHQSTKHLSETWVRTDEWYNFKEMYDKTKTLITIDESTYEGGENGEFHPVSWYHDYDGGRSWYTALGHTKESYTDSDFLRHLLGGIKYALGKKKV